jgi:hypothetical protein
MVSVPGTYEFVEAISARVAPLPEGCGVCEETGVGETTGGGVGVCDGTPCGVEVLEIRTDGEDEVPVPVHAATVASAAMAKTLCTDERPITHPPVNACQAEPKRQRARPRCLDSSLSHHGPTFHNLTAV